MRGRSRGAKALLIGAAAVGAVAAARAVARGRRDYDLRGKTVLLTGGSRGLGLILARQLARQGAAVALCARDEDELERARQDLAERHGADVFTAACDATDRGQVERTVARVRERFGAIDVLINNAGTIQVGPMEVMTDEDYEEAMRTHFWAPYYATQAVLPEMRARRSGRIVNISSIGGKIAIPHLLPYSASKFALVGFSEGMRAELLKDGVYVTTVCPGLIRTGSPRNAMFKGQHKKEYAWFSISDSLPGASMSADRAAAQIIEALRHGDADLVTSVPAKVMAAFHGLFPGATADLMGLCNRVLPRPGGIGTGRAAGRDSQSALSPSPLTALTEKAARANNEMG